MVRNIIRIKTRFLECILNNNMNIIEFQNFINDYYHILKTYPEYYIKLKTEEYIKNHNKISYKLKKKDSIDLIMEKHKDVLEKIIDNYDCYIDFFMFINKDTFNRFLEYLKSVPIDIVQSFYQQLKNIDIKQFMFTTDSLTGIQTFSINYGIKEKNNEMILTNGSLFYFGQCCSNIYDVYLDNATYFFKIKKENFKNELINKLTVSTFDIKLPTKKELLQANLNYLNSEELHNRTLYIKHLFTLNSIITRMVNDKNQLYLSLNKITDDSTLLDENIKILEKQIQELIEQKNKLYNQYEKYKFNEALLNMNLKIFQEYEKRKD